MRARVAVQLSAMEVRAVLSRRGVVRWNALEAVAPGESIERAVERVLRVVPWPRGARRRVTAVVDYPFCRVRELEGLPPVTSRALLTELVRANADAFFPRTAGGSVIPELWSTDDGRLFGAAISRDLAHRLADAAKTAGCGLVAICPSMRTLEQALAAAGSTDSLPASFVAMIAPPDVEWRDAIIAADPHLELPFVWWMIPRFRIGRVLQYVAGALLMILAFVSVVGAAATPTIRAAFVLHQRAPTDPRWMTAEREAARVSADLRRGRAVIDDVTRLRTEHREMTRLLGGLSETLPESTAVVALHIDSLEVRFVALAPSVIETLPAIATVSGVGDPHITGSVTREIAGGTMLERAAFRFRRTRALAATRR